MRVGASFRPKTPEEIREADRKAAETRRRNAECQARLRACKRRLAERKYSAIQAITQAQAGGSLQ